MGKRDRSDSDKKAKKRSRNDKTKDDDNKIATTSEKNIAPDVSSVGDQRKKTPTKKESSARLKKSIFLKKKIDVELSLLPGSLHNTDDAVQDSLNQLLMKFSDGLGGILLAYENVRINKDGKGEGRGFILNELPWIHYTVSCDALVFRPYIGCELHGVVNECFPSHLGMLVLNYFNAMVSAEQLHGAGYSFDADLQKWVSESGAQTISVDSKITFEVDKIHECEGTMSLEGVNPSLSLLVEA